MTAQTNISSIHQGGIGHLPGDESGYLSVPNNALDPTLMVRDPAAGSMTAADAALVAALPGKLAIGIKDATGAIAYTGFMLVFI